LVTVPSQQSFTRSGYMAAFFQPFRLVGYSVLVLFVVWVTAIAAMYFSVQFRWHGAIEPAQQLLRDSGADTFRLGGIAFFREHALDAAILSENFLMKIVGADVLIGTAQTELDQAMARGFQALAPFLVSVVIATKFVVLRLMLLASASPIILIGWLLGFIDGLVGRAIRRDIVGRERAGLYHRGKIGLGTLATALVLGYVALPWMPRLEIISLIAAIGAALLAHLQWTHFKKYR
jgi:Domain of unknown function (DUF4400)